MSYRDRLASRVPKGHVNPLLSIKLSPDLNVAVSTHTRLETLVRSERAAFEHQTGLNIDISGGMALNGKEKVRLSLRHHFVVLTPRARSATSSSSAR